MTVETALQWDSELAAVQRDICTRFGAAYYPCHPQARLGLASNITAATRNLNGVRIEPSGDACGWYLWAGDEWAEPPEFYIPLRAQSVATWVPQALAYLGLPPGWRFLLRDDRIDVWKDLTLLAPAEIIVAV